MRETHNENVYKPGDWWHECPVCGFDYRISEMKERWDGVLVCKKDWEPRNPLDKVEHRSGEPITIRRT